jgi:hypothetical protein
VPAVATSHPSLDAASGAAAVRAEPTDPAALAHGIRTALADAAVLVERGRAHAARFTWEANARAHLAAWSR